MPEDILLYEVKVMNKTLQSIDLTLARLLEELLNTEAVKAK